MITDLFLNLKASYLQHPYPTTSLARIDFPKSTATNAVTGKEDAQMGYWARRLGKCHCAYVSGTGNGTSLNVPY